MIIAFEGIDAAGKKTQADLLTQYIKECEPNMDIKQYNFPDYDTLTGGYIHELISRPPLLSNPRDITNYYFKIHSLMAINRNEQMSDILSHDVSIVNRWYYSNLAYGISHGISQHYLQWFDSETPPADMIFYLDISPETSFNRRPIRYDLFESGVSYLQYVRDTYFAIFKGNCDCIMVESNKLSTHEVQSIIWYYISNELELIHPNELESNGIDDDITDYEHFCQHYTKKSPCFD